MRSIDYPDGLFDDGDMRSAWFQYAPQHSDRQIRKEVLVDLMPGTRLVIQSGTGRVYHATLIECHERSFQVVYDQFGGSSDFPDNPFYTDHGLCPDERGYWNHANWVELESPLLSQVLRTFPRRMFVVEKLDWREYGF